jgi:hypothetical protein
MRKLVWLVESYGKALVDRVAQQRELGFVTCGVCLREMGDEEIFV